MAVYVNKARRNYTVGSIYYFCYFYSGGLNLRLNCLYKSIVNKYIRFSRRRSAAIVDNPVFYQNFDKAPACYALMPLVDMPSTK